jgi:hypothetical protein
MANMTHGGNPFATAFVRPGALPYLFEADVSARSLVAKLRSCGWWGQIVGPHGSGKSTLLASLVPRLEEAGRRPACVTLHEGQRTLPVDASDITVWDADTQVVVDGYEQLGWLARLRLKSTCRRRGSGLLVTAHQDVGLPPLWTTATSDELAWQIVSLLIDREQKRPGAAVIARVDVIASRRRHGDNLREALFELYDLYEDRAGRVG